MVLLNKTFEILKTHSHRFQRLGNLLHLEKPTLYNKKIANNDLSSNFHPSSGHLYPNRPYENLLVVIKHTPYEMYKQLKLRGEAPLALRWERLKHRHNTHVKSVASLLELLKRQFTSNIQCIGREELAPQHVEKADLVVSIGGDGTVLSVSHFLDDSIPLLGVNSDPSLPSEKQVAKKTDERRSHGALCYCTSSDMHELLPMVLGKEVMPTRRTRIQTVIQSMLKETKLPPALNDVLIAHPSPAAVSRFRLALLSEMHGDGEEEEIMYLNVWSSGIWIATPTGSTGAMGAAGGVVVPSNLSELQYMVREHLLEKGYEKLKSRGHGMVGPLHKLAIRWSSQEGRVYVDGDHVSHRLQLGDQVEISGAAPQLLLYY